LKGVVEIFSVSLVSEVKSDLKSTIAIGSNRVRNQMTTHWTATEAFKN